MDDPSAQLEKALAGPPAQEGLSDTPENLQREVVRLRKQLATGRQLCETLQAQRDVARAELADANGLIRYCLNLINIYYGWSFWQRFFRGPGQLIFELHEQLSR